MLTFNFRNALGLHGEAGWLLDQLAPKPKVDILRLHGLDSELWLGQLYHPLPGMKLYIIHRTCRVYDSIADLGEIEVYLGSKFQSCFIDDFGMSGSLLQYWKYVKQI